MPGLDIHAGIWCALEELGVYATANAGTSAGAIVGALNSDGQRSSTVTAMLRGLSDRDVRSRRFAWPLRIRHIDSFLKHEPIEKLLEKLLPPTFSDLKKPLTVCMTHEETGRSALALHGDLRRAVLASMSIAGVFPPVSIGEKVFSDGGPSQFLPLPGDYLAYDELWMLCAKRPLSYAKRNGSIIARMMYNIDLLYEAQVAATIFYTQQNHGCVRVIHPHVEAPRGSLEFDHGLIGEAYSRARLMVKSRGWA